jgi:small subunit ribosomal protein S20
MANHKSSEKRIRQTVTRTAVNRARESRIKTFLKKVEVAIVAGNQAAAKQALKEAQPELMRGVSKGVVKLGTASRKLSRLSARIKKLAA